MGSIIVRVSVDEPGAPRADDVFDVLKENNIYGGKPVYVDLMHRKDLLKEVRLSAEEIEASILEKIDEKVIAVVTETANEWKEAFEKESAQVLFLNVSLLLQHKVLKSLNRGVVAKEDK